MTTPAVHEMESNHRVVVDSEVPAKRIYRANTSFVAVHFNQAGKGRIVFLPKGAMLDLIGPSSCVPGGSEVAFEKSAYNVFEIDLTARSTLIYEPNRAKRRPMAACA
jgi:hypothetical protein